MKRITAFVLKTVAEFAALNVPLLSNGVYDLYRVETDETGKVVGAVLGTQYYVASNKLSAFGKYMDWAPITCEEFQAQGHQIPDRPYSVFTFDLATGTGVGNRFSFRYCNAPEVGTMLDDSPHMLPVKLSGSPSTTVKVSRLDADGGKLAPGTRKAKVVESAPVVASAIDRPAPTLAEQEVMSNAFQVGADETSMKERGVVTVSASAKALAKAKAKAAK